MYKNYTKNIGMPKRYISKILLIMRLTTVILIATIMQVSAISFGQKISLNTKNAPLNSIIKEISKQSGYEFFFDDNLIKNTKPVTINTKNSTIEEVLKLCFNGQPISYKIEDRVVSLKAKQPSFIEGILSKFQLIDVTGFIQDENGQPLAGATIKVKNTNRAVLTDNRGHFIIEGIDENAILVASYIGYKSKEFPARQSGPLILKLELETSNLENVNIVSTGYQTLSKERATGSFEKMLAILTDNYKFRESWAYDNEGTYYQGPWEFMLRNIDPSFILWETREKYPDKDFGLKEYKSDWWTMENYAYWNRLPLDWASSIADLPDAIKCIQKTDTNGTEWLHLNMNYTWKQPKQVGEDSYRTDRREIWYMFQAYLIKKKDKVKAVTFLKDQNFHGRRFPEDHATTDLLAREHYWSPISKQELKGRKEWIDFDKAGCKVVLTNKYAVGELSQDKSGAHFYYQMPCKMMLGGMELRYGRKDGDFVNRSGEVVMSNDSLNGIMIRKTDFLDYLESNELDVFWVFLGEKNSFSKNEKMKDFRKSLSGVYYFETGRLTGDMNMSDW